MAISDVWRCTDCGAECSCLADHSACGPHRLGWHHLVILDDRIPAEGDPADVRERFPGE